jgi:hypothetical protein
MVCRTGCAAPISRIKAAHRQPQARAAKSPSRDDPARLWGRGMAPGFDFARTPIHSSASLHATRPGASSQPREGDTQPEDQTGQAKDDDAVPPDECNCGGHDDHEPSSRAMERHAPMENGPAPQRPLEAGWFTGNWYTTQNTIICDGSGALGINEGTNYQHGVQDCSRQHEASHRTDWYARYGNDICKSRAKGDLPYFNPPGKEAYADFLKKSECAAWKVGDGCRKTALAACADDACKNYVQTFVTQSGQMVTSYCG